VTGDGSDVWECERAGQRGVQGGRRGWMDGNYCDALITAFAFTALHTTHAQVR